MRFSKNLLRFVVLLPMMVGLAFGQGLTGYGAKAGLSLANVGGSDAEDTNMKLGLTLGGYATFDFGLPVVIQPEAMFSQKGYKWEEGDDKATVGINYLDINALAVYPINDQIRAFAGPSFGLFISGKVKAEWDGESDEEDIESDDMNGMDMAFIVGGGYTLALPFGDIDIEARYSLGLKEAYEEDWDMKNNVIQIVAGYAF